MSEPGVSLRFDVMIDDIEIGSFMKVDGLTVQYEVTQYKEGGENTYVHQLPGRLKHNNLTLTRPLDDVSAGLASWFATLAQGKGQDRHTMSIVAKNGNGEDVETWTVNGVYPVKYQGPSFDAGGTSVATESLELAHKGFTSEGGGSESPGMSSLPSMPAPPSAPSVSAEASASFALGGLG